MIRVHGAAAARLGATSADSSTSAHACSTNTAKYLVIAHLHALAGLVCWRLVRAEGCPDRLIGFTSPLAQPRHATAIEGRALAHTRGGCYPDARRQAVSIA
jgi:hypothetical protein